MKLRPGTEDTEYRQAQRRLRRDNGVITWKCDGCGKVAPWDDDWSWYGSLKDLEDYGAEAEGVLVVCSDDCKPAAKASR